MSLKNLLTVQTWEMTLLTPLHVGDGGSHLLNQDYVANGRNIEVLDLDDILERLEDNPMAIGEMGRGQFNLSRFIRDYKLCITPRYVFANVTTIPKDIRRFLKNAHGQAYVPGSSLKGALRTALLQLTSDKFHACRDFFELSKKVKSYKSRDPHHDFIRPLHVSDSQGLVPSKDLDLSEIKFFNLQAAETPGWKDFASRRTGPDFRQAAGVFVETLKSGTKLHVQVGLDEFLISDSGAKAAGIPRESALLNFRALAKVLNQHAFRMVAAEKAFFAKYASATSSTAHFYKELLDEITRSAEDGFYLRMAWGSGWRGMTGNWMDDELAGRVRKAKRLGKVSRDGELFPVFPKSRRLAMRDGVPSLPLGWVHVRFAEKTLFRTVAGSSLSKLETPAFSGAVSPLTGSVEVAQAAAAPPLPPPDAQPVQRVTWNNAFLTYLPNTGEINAKAEGKKAVTKDKSLVPDSIAQKLFGKKKKAQAGVLVEPQGNAFALVKILADN